MPYGLENPTRRCPICGEAANTIEQFGTPVTVDCVRCGDFLSSVELIRDWESEISRDPNKKRTQALASHLIRRNQSVGRPYLDKDFFQSLSKRTLPTPGEAADNLVLWCARELDGVPGNDIAIDRRTSLDVCAEVGVVDGDSLYWLCHGLHGHKIIQGNLAQYVFQGNLSFSGWQKVEELRRSRTDSMFAFFARKFSNPELDQVVRDCLEPAVREVGYELRTVTVKAGLIDAIIEDEIRRCRFVIADLSDDNAGAYWEAGFAEGLGKPVIYICREQMDGQKKRTHFDTDHRQTVRWDLSSLEKTAAKLTATIRNTLVPRGA